MGLRRFLNLIVDNRIPGAKSLRCIDLTRHNYKLFNTSSPVALPLMNGSASASEGPQKTIPFPGDGKKSMKTIQLPAPSINFRSSVMPHNWRIDCFPLAGPKLLCTDHDGHNILFDTDTREVKHMPDLLRPKLRAFFFSVVNDDDPDGGCIYIIEDFPYKELLEDATEPSHQFEAFVYCKATRTWNRRILPPPPFVLDPKNFVCHSARPLIRSYAVVGGGGGSASHVCFSVEGAGTYCLNTVTHTWTQVGEWTLPFQGKVEYVPELKLWLGICAKGLHLGVADLSTMGMDSPPRLLGTWKELDVSQGWMEVQDPQLVNLGSGRFCIARFFQAPSPMVHFHDSDDDTYAEYFTVLTGMDVVLCLHDSNGTANTTYSNGSNGKVKLQMISHNSTRHMSYGSDGTIKVVF